MNDLLPFDDTSRVFGFLYFVVFDSGVMKAGISRKSPAKRITDHAGSARAFDINVAKTIVCRLYSPDVLVVERSVHLAAARVARLTSGREWFKFESVDAAVAFSEEYSHLSHLKSYEKRPSALEISLMDDAQRKRADAIMGLVLQRGMPLGDVDERSSILEELSEIEADILLNGAPSARRISTASINNAVLDVICDSESRSDFIRRISTINEVRYDPEVASSLSLILERSGYTVDNLAGFIECLLNALEDQGVDTSSVVPGAWDAIELFQSDRTARSAADMLIKLSSHSGMTNHLVMPVAEKVAKEAA